MKQTRLKSSLKWTLDKIECNELNKKLKKIDWTILKIGQKLNKMNWTKDNRTNWKMKKIIWAKLKNEKILKTGQKLIGKIERNWKILNNLKYYIQVC